MTSGGFLEQVQAARLIKTGAGLTGHFKIEESRCSGPRDFRWPDRIFLIYHARDGKTGKVMVKQNRSFYWPVNSRMTEAG